MGYGYLAPGRSKPRGYASNLLSGFNPESLSLDLWLEARSGTFSDAGTTPAVDTDPVYRWNDLSGNNNHASQTTLGNRPTLQTVSGKKVVRPDGSNDFMTLASTLSFTGNFTIVAVLKTDGSDGYVLIRGDGQHQIRVNQTADKLSTFEGSNNPQSDAFASALTNWSQCAWRRSSTTVSFFEGTTARGTGTMVGTIDLAAIFDRSGGASFLGGDIAAIFAVGRALSDEELTSLVIYGESLHP